MHVGLLLRGLWSVIPTQFIWLLAVSWKAEVTSCTEFEGTNTKFLRNNCVVMSRDSFIRVGFGFLDLSDDWSQVGRGRPIMDKQLSEQEKKVSFMLVCWCLSRFDTFLPTTHPPRGQRVPLMRSWWRFFEWCWFIELLRYWLEQLFESCLKKIRWNASQGLPLRSGFCNASHKNEKNIASWLSELLVLSVIGGFWKLYRFLPQIDLPQ